MYLLDTNVIFELRQIKPRQSASVRAWAAGVAAGQLYLSAISILELEKGVMLLERRTPPQGSALRAWLGATVRAFEGRVLPFTGNTAALCAALHIPDPRPERDVMIAASLGTSHDTGHAQHQRLCPYGPALARPVCWVTLSLSSALGPPALLLSCKKSDSSYCATSFSSTSRT